jgi:hypothetical protein
MPAQFRYHIGREGKGMKILWKDIYRGDGPRCPNGTLQVGTATRWLEGCCASHLAPSRFSGRTVNALS